jgi:hypothetical protein
MNRGWRSTKNSTGSAKTTVTNATANAKIISFNEPRTLIVIVPPARVLQRKTRTDVFKWYGLQPSHCELNLAISENRKNLASVET